MIKTLPGVTGSLSVSKKVSTWEKSCKVEYKIKPGPTHAVSLVLGASDDPLAITKKELMEAIFSLFPFDLVGAKVFVLSVMNEDDEFQVESVHATEAGAEARKVKISQENGFDKEDAERYFLIETKVINN